MQFQLVKKHEFWWPVTVKVPTDGGSFIEQQLDVRFVAQTREEAMDAIEAIGQMRDARARSEAEYEQMRGVVLDWRGVVDEHQRAVEMSAEAFREAFQHTWFRAGINAAYADALNGVSAEGN